MWEHMPLGGQWPFGVSVRFSAILSGISTEFITRRIDSSLPRRKSISVVEDTSFRRELIGSIGLWSKSNFSVLRQAD